MRSEMKVQIQILNEIFELVRFPKARLECCVQKHSEQLPLFEMEWTVNLLEYC